MDKNYNLPVNGKERIVIIGAGFAGLKLARYLRHSPYQVVVIDKRNFHQFQPLFYQVATSGIEPGSISFPIRKIFQKHDNLHFRQAELWSIDDRNQNVVTSFGILSYDYLVLAAGVGTNYFGSKNIEMNSLPMKSTAEAINLRNRILQSFEKAILTEDKAEQASLMSVAIVGGGPTGVELAGAIAEMRKYVLPKDYPELDFGLMKIFLYEAGDRLLNGMSENSGRMAVRFLEKLAVNVMLGTRIDDYDGEQLFLSNGKEESIRNLIWTAGVAGNPINGLGSDKYVSGKRIAVDGFNQVIGMRNIYALGDMCLMADDEKYPNGHPQVAQVAIQQAVNLGKNMVSQNTWRPFKYLDKGSMATVGRNMAVVDLPFFRFSGVLAWMMWLFIHLMALVGIKNRFFIFINWAQSYIWRDQSLRVLIRPFMKNGATDI